MPSSLNAFCQGELESIQDKGLLRGIRPLESAQGTTIQHGGRSLSNFSSNDYLGLANHSFLRERARQALDIHGVGSGASPLISGALEPQMELQEAIAKLKDTEASLIFTSGYAAAMGTLPALFGSRDILVIDKLCHACLVDGARMSGAKIRVFRHNDMASLERLLQWSRQNMQSRSLAEQGKIGVLGESVYSMDGDVAPLKSMAALKERYGAWLMIDEAHATGVFGRKGEGLIHALGLSGRIEIQMGTLGKALGCSGGFVAGTRQLVDLLINKARSFIFSTAPSPSVSAASLAAVEIIQSEEGSLMREQLFRNIQCFWGGIPDAWKNRTTEGGNLQGLKCALAPETPILSWHVGDAQTALTLSKELLACGFFVPAIRYPTVPRGTARLRITLSAAHTEAMIESLMIGLLACHEKLIVGS